jgi:uroporphyrinogen decarboxylase
MMRRREFLTFAAAAVALDGKTAKMLSHKERVDRALAGNDVDRPPFSFWHHFGLKTPEEHAKATLDFHLKYRTDIVKVMSDFPYPKPPGAWYELKVDGNPFPQQIRALEQIRAGLNGGAYFVETIFNPWNVAEKLSSKEELRRLQTESPRKLLDALDVITQSEIHHAKRALMAGASGILLSVANANAQEMPLEDYRKFSAAFDRRILAAIPDARLNILHLHVEASYLDTFRDFPAPIVNYSRAVSGIPVETVRSRFPQVIAGGLDEVHFRDLGPSELRAQWNSARSAAGPKFILTPGCSVPNDSRPEELARLPQLLGA